MRTYEVQADPVGSVTRPRLVVFGGGGATGRLIVARAIARGFDVTIASRSARAEEGATAIACDVTDQEAVDAAVAGHDAVVYAVGTGHAKRSELRTRGAACVVAAMKKHGVGRLVAMSGLGAGESFDVQPWIFRAAIAPLFLRGLLDDQSGLERVVRASGLDWTLVRPGQLVDQPAKGAPVTSLDGRGVASKVSREAVAELMVGELVSPRFSRTAVAVGNA